VNVKRPDKIKLDLCEAPPGLMFTEFIGRKDSVYVRKITEALSSASVISIAAADTYLRMQFQKAAKKLKMKLVFAQAGDLLYIKPIVIEGELKRLLLLLREPRTLVELQTKKLELHLENSLSGLAKDGLAHFQKDKWKLTEKGMDAL
jgi:hypothetical protein